MSMNLYVERTRKAFAIVRGKKKEFKDRSSFNLWQTPTSVTRSILSSFDAAEAYIEWVRSCENHCGENHITDFREWLTESSEEGYVVNFYEM